jgi:hypothetical protein
VLSAQKTTCSRRCYENVRGSRLIYFAFELLHRYDNSAIFFCGTIGESEFSPYLIDGCATLYGTWLMAGSHVLMDGPSSTCPSEVGGKDQGGKADMAY